MTILMSKLVSNHDIFFNSKIINIIQMPKLILIRHLNLKLKLRTVYTCEKSTFFCYF